MSTKTQLSKLKKEDLVQFALSLESKALSAEQLAFEMAAELAEERKFSKELQDKIAGVFNCVGAFMLSMPDISKFNFSTIIMNWRKIIALLQCVNSELNLFENIRKNRAARKASAVIGTDL